MYLPDFMTKASLELMDSLDFLTFFWAPILTECVTNTFSSLKKRGIQLVKSLKHVTDYFQVGSTRTEFENNFHMEYLVEIIKAQRKLVIRIDKLDSMLKRAKLDMLLVLASICTG